MLVKHSLEKNILTPWQAVSDVLLKQNEPKVWFESLQSMSQILSSQNQELLKVIIEKQLKSLKELELLTGRAKRNLSRTLYGIVKLEKVNNAFVPIVNVTRFSVESGLDMA